MVTTFAQFPSMFVAASTGIPLLRLAGGTDVSSVVKSGVVGELAVRKALSDLYGGHVRASKVNAPHSQIDSFSVFGLSHVTATVEERGRLKMNDDLLKQFYQGLLSYDFIDEAMVLSTCSRFEVYLSSKDPKLAHRIVRRELVSRLGVEDEKSHSLFYQSSGKDALVHLTRVASGLDSMVLGEDQIIGQVRNASKEADKFGTFGKMLRQLVPISLKSARKARESLVKNGKPTSVPAAAVALANNKMSGLGGKTAIVIGAGDMGAIAIYELARGNIGTLYVANRDPEKAKRLAGKYTDGQAIPFDRYHEHVIESDIVVTSTSAPTFLITEESMRDVMKKREGRPIILVDVSSPPNIDPAVADMDGVTLINLDSLKEVVDKNRREATDASEKIVREDTLRYLHERRIAPVIAQIIPPLKRIVRQKAEEARVDPSSSGTFLRDIILWVKGDPSTYKHFYRRVALVRALFGIEEEVAKYPELKLVANS